jgi:hypothetical protein
MEFPENSRFVRIARDPRPGFRARASHLRGHVLPAAQIELVAIRRANPRLHER